MAVLPQPSAPTAREDAEDVGAPETAASRTAAPRTAAPAPAPVHEHVFRDTRPPSAALPTALGTPRRAVPGGGWWDLAVTGSVLTAFAVLIISGRVVTEGPVLLTLSRTHGVHAGDLVVLAAWVLAVATTAARVVRGRRAARTR